MGSEPDNRIIINATYRRTDTGSDVITKKIFGADGDARVEYEGRNASGYPYRGVMPIDSFLRTYAVFSVRSNRKRA